MASPVESEPNNLIAWLILGYLCSHPYAKDTASGVAKWWLGTQGLTATCAEVQTALDHLAANGWVTVYRSPLRQPIYGLDPVRLEDIQKVRAETSSET